MIDLEKDELVEEKVLKLLAQPEKRPFSDGMVWLKKSLVITKERFGTWFLMGLAMLGISMVVGVVAGFIGIVPLFGGIVLKLLWNWLGLALMGGFVVSVASWVEEGDLATSYLFTGIKYKWKECLITAAIITGITLIITGIFNTVLSMNGIEGVDWQDPQTFKNLPVGMSFFMSIIVLAFSVFISMMSWFTLPLMMLHDIQPWQAIKMNVKGCLNNIMPFLCYGLVSTLVFMGIGVMFIITAMLFSWIGIVIILIFLGIVIWAIAAAGMYVSYRNVWTNLPIDE